MDIETADYIIKYFSTYFTEAESLAMRHYSSIQKLDGEDSNSPRTKMYEQKGWLTKNTEALNLLNDGFESFKITAAKRILKDNQNKIFLNYCPKCNKLARTPHAKQCRFCNYDWHNE